MINFILGIVKMVCYADDISARRTNNIPLPQFQLKVVRIR
ncbi:unnamed protein product, partial [marine sediment metagenome]